MCATLSLVLAVLLNACGNGNAGPEPGVVAEAAGQVWTVEEIASLVAPDPQIPADSAAVRAIADLWVDYILLGTAAAEDSAMAHVDVTPLVQELVQTRLLMTLRDSAVQVDTPDAAELRRLYDEEAPGSLVRARQILLRWTEEASPAERDSIRQRAAELRRRIVEGESFASVASAHSEDPLSAGRGGEIGLIRPRQMIAPLRGVLDSLDVGEVSQPVESPFGVHLFAVDERQTPSFESFRTDQINLRTAQAESAYIAGLEETAGPEPAADAAEILRELARDPRTLPDERRESRPVVLYEGGEVTIGEVQRYLQNQSPQVRAEIARSEDEDVAARVLRALTQRELLVAEAQRRGWSVRPEIQEMLARTARENLTAAARQLELLPIEVAEGEDRGEAVKRAVGDLLADLLSGAKTEVTPLGVMSHVLRAQYPARVYDERLDEVVARIEELRTGSAPADSALPEN